MSMLEALEKRFGPLDEGQARAAVLAFLDSPPGLVGELRVHGSARQALSSLSRVATRACGKPGLSWLEQELADIQNMGLSLVWPGESGWPDVLDDLEDPPALLHVWGDLSTAMVAPALALVGSRYGSEYGQRIALGFATTWASAGGSVVSGGALGVDTAAHEGCLEVGGISVAVLGSGLADPYPAVNLELFDRIAKQGAVVSELPLRARPRAFNFPRRNRIIAALSRAVIVTQAKKRSGALYTATFALKCSRLLFTVPGPVDEAASAGGLELLTQGVPAMVGTDQLMELFGELAGHPASGAAMLPFAVRPHVSLSGLDRVTRVALETLARGAVHVDDLAAKLELEPSRLSLLLLEMEMKRWVEKQVGNHYACTVRLER